MSESTHKQVADALRKRYEASTAGEKSAIRKAAEDTLGVAKATQILGKPSSKAPKSEAVSTAESLLSQLAS